MKRIFNLLLLASLTILSCNKETPTTQTDLMNSMLINKNWYLDYSVTGNISKSYVGQTTYFVTYLKDGTTSDSDGLKGTYTVELNNAQSQIHVQVKTSNGNALEVVYNIISVGDKKLELSKQVSSSTPTQLFFTSK